LLGAARFTEGVAAWRNSYDHVVFDAPPVLGVTDALVLAQRVGRVLLVVRTGRTTDRELRRTVEHLRSAGVDVLGVILNGHKAGTEVYAAYGYTYPTFQADR